MWVWLCAFRIEWARVRRGTAGFLILILPRYSLYTARRQTTQGDDVEAEQTRRARRGREQDFAEISRRMYEEITWLGSQRL